MYHTPSFRLDGRRALVTGASRGLGFAAACALAEAGAIVTLLARTASRLEEATGSILAKGYAANSMVLDVTDTTALTETIAGMEPFDILVNNAGTNRPKPIFETTAQDFDAVMGLNLRATYFVSRIVAEGMLSSVRGGSIINMSSQMGHVGSPNRTVYCASKHAVEGLTKSLAVELGPNKIRVNSICPTFIETDMTKPFLADRNFRAHVMDKIVLDQPGQPEDIMGAIVYLASDASSLVTGSSLMVDGGWTAA